MKTLTLSVREHARLTTSACPGEPDRHQIGAAAFDWLYQLQAGLPPGSARLLELENRQCLRLNSLVGVVQTPCGTTLEILPKTHGDNDDIGQKFVGCNKRQRITPFVDN